MASARAKQTNTELLEDRERWLCVFKECFAEDCTAHDLQELKPPFVFSIYLKFAKIFLGASLDNMKLIGINCPEDMQRYPEAYEKSILTPKVAKLLSWFFNARYGNSSFTFEDLICATPGRTRLFFNYIVDFAYDFTEWQAKVEEIASEVEQRKKSMLELQQERDRLVGSIEQLRKQKAENRIAEEEELQLKQALVTEVEAKKEEKVALKSQFEAKRAKLAELSEAARQTDAECETLSETVRQLEACVVSEHERDCLKQRKQQLREVAADNAQKRQQLGALENVAGETGRTIALLRNDVLVQARDLQQQLDQLSELKNMEGQSARHGRAVVACSELDHEISVLKQRVTQLEEVRRADQGLRTNVVKGIEADIEAAREMLSQLRRADEKWEAEDKHLTEQLEAKRAQLDCLSEEEAQLDVFFCGLHTQLMEGKDQHIAASKATVQRFIDEVSKRQLE